jgi:hypothetical protein
MDNEAVVTFKGDRYDLTIGGVLKAYTTDGSEQSKKELMALATDKGYKIREEKGE